VSRLKKILISRHYFLKFSSVRFHESEFCFSSYMRADVLKGRMRQTSWELLMGDWRHEKAP